MSTRRSLLRTLAAAAATLPGSAACRSSDLGGAPPPQLAPASLEFHNHWASGSPGEQGWRTIIGKFRDTYPQLTVQSVQYSGFDKVVAAVVAGAPPDLIDMCCSGSLYPSAVARGMLVNLDPRLKSGRAVTRSSFLPGILQLMTLEGGTYGVPTESGAVILYYNADLLRELGLSPPESTWRWDREYLDAARRVTREAGPAETQRFGAEHVNRGYWGGGWWTHLWADGGDLLTKDQRRCALLEGTGVEGIQFAADLAHRWRVVPTAEARATGPTSGVNVSFFESGRLAFFPSGHFHYIFIKQRAQFQWGVAPLPQGRAGSKTWTNAWLTGIGAGTQNQDAAWAFLEYCLRPENYAEFLRFVSWMPPIKMADRPPLIEDARHWTVMSSWVAQNGRPLPAIPRIDDVLTLAKSALQPVLDTGEKTARAAAQELCPQIDTAIVRG